MITVSRIRKNLAGMLGVAVVAGGLALASGAPAQALPPGGAGPDTPGTSSSISPSSVAVGGAIRFTVSGYPAGETINVKVDDGQGYSDQTVQGAGVVYQQKIAADGTVSGSFPLPAFVRPGNHWLRFLASQEFTDSQGNVGVNGFTNHSPNFTVVASGASRGTGGSTGSSGGNGSGGSAGSGGGGSTTTGGGAAADGSSAAVPNPGVVTAKPTQNSAVEATPSGPASSAPTASATSSETPTSAALASDNSSSPSGGGFPALGVGIFAGVVVVAAVGVWLALRRKPDGRLKRAPAE